MFHVPNEAEFLTLLFTVTVFLAKSVYGVPAREFQIISDSEAVSPVGGEAIDLLVSSRSGDKQTDQRLFGTFSAAGRNYETSGDIVQVFPYRACDIKRKGYDRTLLDHIAIVFFDDLEPFITGCVSLDNQVRFAEKSGALGLVVGPESRVVAQIDKTQRGRIPVVMLDDLETKRLKKQLNEASQSGSVIRITFEYVDFGPQYTLRLQIFRPTVLNIGLIILLVLLLAFITGLVYIKIRWRPTSHRDIWLRTLARSAVNKMEIRKFEKTGSIGVSTSHKLHKKRSLLCLPSRRRYLPVFGSLTSVARSYGSQERCSICLEEYKEGQELRVLFCGHEFHPKCVDPWLLSNRRCPLCQYDVVYKEYPRTEKTTKNCQASSTSVWDSSNRPDAPLLPMSDCNDTTTTTTITATTAIAPSFAHANSYMQLQPDIQLSVENNKSCSNNINIASDSKKRRRQFARLGEMHNYRHWLGVNRSSIVCPQHITSRDIIRNRSRDVVNLRSSRRYLQNRSRSLGAHQRRQVQRPRRPSIFPVNVATTTAAAAAADFPTTSRELPQQPKETMETVSGYSSDISSYPELDRPNTPPSLSVAVAASITTRYHSFVETISSGQSSESNSRQQQQQRSTYLRRTYPPVETISKLPTVIPFPTISFEKHQIL